jgi:hypothetical protein
MPQFTGGPSVRVNPNVSIEFKWNTDVAWFGKVDVFDSPTGTVPIFTQWAVDPGGNNIGSMNQVVTIPVAGPVTANATLYFAITAQDPGDPLASFCSCPVGAPTLFCTGPQLVSNVTAKSITENSATVTWESNVFSIGRVTLNNGTVGDDLVANTAHIVQFNNLPAGTTFQFTAADLHQIDKDVLASGNGQFTTTAAAPPPPQPTNFVITEPHAEPRQISAAQVSTVSIRAKNQGNPVQGAVVSFAIAAGGPNAGAGTLSAAQATTDANGIASVNLTGTARGMVDVQVSSPNATNGSLKIPVIVK